MNKNYSIVLALMMFFNFSLFSQDGPPWDFNGTDHGFVASNYSALAAGDTYLTYTCLLYTSPSPRDMRRSRMPSSA